MVTSSKELARKLDRLAGRQHGCFTAAQAIQIGYADSVHLYHVKTGSWVRIYRGVYRLAAHPETPEARCMAALLWTRGKNGRIQGFLKAETAQALLAGNLAPGDPIHLAVETGFRRSSLVSAGILITSCSAGKHISLIINGLPMEKGAIQPSSSPAIGPEGLDMPDYYDWLDFHSSRCAPSS